MKMKASKRLNKMLALGVSYLLFLKSDSNQSNSCCNWETKTFLICVRHA